MLFERASWVVLVVMNLPANAEDIRDGDLIPGSGNPLEEGMATHSSVLAWRVPRRIVAGAWRTTVHRVTKSQTGLKQLSTHAL